MVGSAVIFWILNCGTGALDENFYKTEFQSKCGLLEWKLPFPIKN